MHATQDKRVYALRKIVSQFLTVYYQELFLQIYTVLSFNMGKNRIKS